MTPTALLLDLDDTLYAYAPCHKAGLDAFRNTWVALGLGSHQNAELAYHQARTRVADQLPGQAASHLRLLYAQLALEDHLGTSSPRLALVLSNAYWDAFLSAMRLEQGVLELLEWASAHQVPVAIVTDMTSELQLRKLVRLGIDPAINFVVSSEEVGIEKPSPEPFLRALQKLGTQPGPSIWMFGDSLERDIVPASQLGLSVAWVRGNSPQTSSAPPESCPPGTTVLAGMADVQDLIVAWGKN